MSVEVHDVELWIAPAVGANDRKRNRMIAAQRERAAAGFELRGNERLDDASIFLILTQWRVARIDDVFGEAQSDSGFGIGVAGLAPYGRANRSRSLRRSAPIG